MRLLIGRGIACVIGQRVTNVDVHRVAPYTTNKASGAVKTTDLIAATLRGTESGDGRRIALKEFSHVYH